MISQASGICLALAQSFLTEWDTAFGLAGQWEVEGSLHCFFCLFVCLFVHCMHLHGFTCASKCFQLAHVFVCIVRPADNALPLYCTILVPFSSLLSVASLVSSAVKIRRHWRARQRQRETLTPISSRSSKLGIRELKWCTHQTKERRLNYKYQMTHFHWLGSSVYVHVGSWNQYNKCIDTQCVLYFKEIFTCLLDRLMYTFSE